MQLFRPEALRGQDRLHGDVVLVPPVSWQLLGFFLFAALIAAGIFLSTARYTSSAIASGQLVGDPSSGRALAAELEIPADAAAFVADGQSVHLAVAVFPQAGSGSLTGRVERVSAAPPPDANGSLVVRVALDPASLRRFVSGRTIRPGMTVRARIATRSRTFGEWMLAPFRSDAR